MWSAPMLAVTVCFALTDCSRTLPVPRDCKTRLHNDCCLQQSCTVPEGLIWERQHHSRELMDAGQHAHGLQQQAEQPHEDESSHLAMHGVNS